MRKESTCGELYLRVIFPMVNAVKNSDPEGTVYMIDGTVQV